MIIGSHFGVGVGVGIGIGIDFFSFDPDTESCDKLIDRSVPYNRHVEKNQFKNPVLSDCRRHHDDNNIGRRGDGL